MTTIRRRNIIAVIALALAGVSPMVPSSASAQTPATEKAEK
jgi:uncharacterized membrane protein YjjB (DUF3815 family)